MPIPTKSLRELLAEAFGGSEYSAFSEGLADVAMSAIAKYDPLFAKAAEKGEPTYTLTIDHPMVKPWQRVSDHACVLQYRKTEGDDISQDEIDRTFRIADAMRIWTYRRGRFD